ncbi:Lsr2 family protein [Asanoa ishikariensis]|uniref:Lsr2 protein n=1 Tax=Asanoa ishikariensis TaxID=137265 RepID=A0A1H3URB6_9ACTN|nr:Lsr2 family protein [Asanoa ishikariensis]GIF69333.1 Lsr2 family protein [Asanoa ishikariensis]SDZ64973.1 Lsr2 protein [Asanoa ishikariensis]
MAKETIVKLVDDIDGSTATQTVTFALDGVAFEIDLSDDNASKLRQALEPFVEAATKVTASGARHTRTVISARGESLRKQTQAIRAWGKKYGPQLGLDPVSDRGAVPQRVRDAYEQHDGRAPRTALASPFLAPGP